MKKKKNFKVIMLEDGTDSTSFMVELIKKYSPDVTISDLTLSEDEIVNMLKEESDVSDSYAEELKSLESAISSRLDRDGMITGRGIGKTHLIDLVILAVQNGGMVGFKLKEHETIVAKKNNTTPTKVSRNVATAIQRTYNYVAGAGSEFEDTPFLRDKRYITPYAIISYYAEIFRHSLD